MMLEIDHQKNNGFTFIETMVVLALFAIVSVSFLSSFSLGMKVWKKTAGSGFSHRRAILNLERLSVELRRVCDYPKIGFWGQKDRLTFANIMEDKILNISYMFSPQEKCIYRTIDQGQGRLLVPGVQNFSLSFYGYDNEMGNMSFLDSWNYTMSRIPSAVKVSLTLQDGRAFEKIVIIPIAQ